MSTHDINGPSQLSKREACPGSAAAEAAIPDEAQTPEASRGSLGHAWMAAQLKGKPMPAIPDDLTEACGYAASVAKGIVGMVRALGMPVPEGDPLVLVEYPVDLSHLGIAKGGTLDLALVWPSAFAIVLDWKFGDAWTDNPKFNRQMQAYTIGLCAAFDVPQAVAGICQPELAEDLRLRLHLFTADEFKKRVEDIRRIVAWTKVADPPLRPGRHCGFCRAKDTCKARQELAGQLSILTNPSGVFFAADPTSRKVMWEKIGHALSVLEKAKKDIIEVAVRESLPIEGYTIGPGKGSRSWASEADAVATMTAIAVEKGIDPSKIQVTRTISPAEAEGLFGKAKAVRERLEPITIKEEGKPTIVPAKGGK